MIFSPDLGGKMAACRACTCKLSWTSFRPPGFSPYMGREERRVQGLDYCSRGLTSGSDISKWKHRRTHNCFMIRWIYTLCVISIEMILTSFYKIRAIFGCWSLFENRWFHRKKEAVSKLSLSRDTWLRFSSRRESLIQSVATKSQRRICTFVKQRKLVLQYEGNFPYCRQPIKDIALSSLYF